MAIKLGKPKHEDKITLKDLQSFPLWTSVYREWDTLRPVVSRDPDVTKEVLKECNYAPTILCTVRDHPRLFAKGLYIKKEKHLTMLRFWQDGHWVKVTELKAPRPLTLVAVPKVEGKMGIEFFLLSRYDLDAPRIGGTLCRFAGPDKFKNQKLARGMVPTPIKDKPRPRSASTESATRSGTVRVTGAKLGPLTDAGKITIKDRIKHPVWVYTFEEDDADEDAQRAVISNDPNASGEVLRKFLATVTFKVCGTEVYGTGAYDRETDALTGLRYWTGKRWEFAGIPKGLSAPLTLEPLCRILGKRNLRFIVKKPKDQSAARVAP